MDLVRVGKIGVGVKVPKVRLRTFGHQARRRKAGNKGNYIIVTCKTDNVQFTINGIKRTYNVIPNKPTKIQIDEKITSLENFSFQQNRYSITFLDISKLDVSSCYSFLRLTGWLDACTEINAAFNLDVPSRDLRASFDSDAALKNLNISTWNMAHSTGWVNYNTVFLRCTSLTNLKFGYNLNKTVDFKDCPLSHESALSVINGLAPVNSTQTITFSKATYNTLTNEEIALATSKGWSVASS